MKSYVDFVELVSKDGQLLSEFKKVLAENSTEKLSGWFEKNGFVVNARDSEKIMTTMKTPRADSTLYMPY